jgi:hypothetical protein
MTREEKVKAQRNSGPVWRPRRTPTRLAADNAKPARYTRSWLTRPPSESTVR